MIERDRIVIDKSDHSIRRFGDVDIRLFFRQDERFKEFMYKLIEKV
jgi:hypothetical protein